MLSINCECFLLIPNEQNERLLLPGKVVQLNDANAIVKFDQPITLKAGDESTIFAQWRDKFLQQGVKIQTAAMNDDPSTIELSRVGEPVSAEGRGSYRVSVAIAMIYGTVDGQKHCHVVDISPEGCAVVCTQPLIIGQTVPVQFEYQNVVVEGLLKVQTLKNLSSGKMRFGLLANEKNSPARKALQKLTVLMQRLQLQRLAGAA
jgi:hypothetical protein